MDATIVDRGRGPEIVGTRITVYDVLDYLELGWHHTAIAATLRVSSDQVLAAMKYVEEHRDDVMAKYQKMLEREARGNPPEIEAKLEAGRAKLRQLLKERRKATVQEPADAGDSRGQ